ncbi:hypothetical protein PTKIN_Ptkin02bG0244200 [Pterospermum kingtungense]
MIQDGQICNWNDGGESPHSTKDGLNFNKPLNPVPSSQEKDKARRGPIFTVKDAGVANNGVFLQNCLIGTMVDTRRFSILTLQRLINNTWKFRDKVTVVSRSGNNYLVHFNDLRDLHYIWLHTLWSLEGALFVFDRWSSTVDFTSFIPSHIPVWVQFRGLPLEYQNPVLCLRLGQMIGEVLQLNWVEKLKRNNTCMRVRVNVRHDRPLFDGCMVQFDNGAKTWIKFHYERLYKVCKKCGIVGHTSPHCQYPKSEIERMVDERMKELQMRRSERRIMGIEDTLFQLNKSNLSKIPEHQMEDQNSVLHTEQLNEGYVQNSKDASLKTQPLEIDIDDHQNQNQNCILSKDSSISRTPSVEDTGKGGIQAMHDAGGTLLTSMNQDAGNFSYEVITLEQGMCSNQDTSVAIKEDSLLQVQHTVSSEVCFQENNPVNSENTEMDVSSDEHGEKSPRKRAAEGFERDIPNRCKVRRLLQMLKVSEFDDQEMETNQSGLWKAGPKQPPNQQ